MSTTFNNSENIVRFKRSLAGIRIFAFAISTITSAICLCALGMNFAHTYVAEGWFMDLVVVVLVGLLCFWIDFRWISPLGRYVMSETTAKFASVPFSGLRWVHLVGAWLMFLSGAAVSGVTTFFGVKIAFAQSPSDIQLGAAGEVSQYQKQFNDALAPFKSRVNELQEERDRAIQNEVGAKVYASYRSGNKWTAGNYGHRIEPIVAAYRPQLDSARANLDRQQKRLEAQYDRLMNGAFTRDELATAALATRTQAGQMMLGIVGIICLGVGVICLWMEGAADVRNVLERSFAKAETAQPQQPAAEPAKQNQNQNQHQNKGSNTGKGIPF